MMLYIAIVFILASCFGSFFKVIVDRYNTEDSFIFKPSYCSDCKNKLLWWNNIPIVGFLLLKGKCYFCKAKIDINCFFAELITGTIAAMLFFFALNNRNSLTEILVLMFFAMILILLSMFDLKHKTIPHLITYSAISILIFSNCFIGGSILNSLASLGISFIVMDSIYFLANSFQKFELDNNTISIPLTLWAIYFLFFENPYYVLLPIIIYFLILKTIEVKKQFSVLFWLLLFILIFTHLYRFGLINEDKLNVFFFGIGTIYFVCEIVFYLLNVFLLKEKDELQASHEVETSIGGGDITVIGLISVFLGYKLGLVTVFLASIISLLAYLIIILINKLVPNIKKIEFKYIPFVPYLTIACFIIIMAFNGR